MLQPTTPKELVELYLESVLTLTADIAKINEKYKDDTDQTRLHYIKKAMIRWFRLNGNLRI